jgi:anti-sigma B factor antagonist
MHLATRQIGDISVIDVSSRNMGAYAPSIRDAVARLHSEGRTRIVLNLAGLEYVDSAGLGDLVTCNIRAAQSGRPLKVAAITPRIEQLLRTTRLATTFDRYATEEEAIASYEAAPPAGPSGSGS